MFINQFYNILKNKFIYFKFKTFFETINVDNKSIN